MKDAMLGETEDRPGGTPPAAGSLQNPWADLARHLSAVADIAARLERGLADGSRDEAASKAATLLHDVESFSATFRDRLRAHRATELGAAPSRRFGAFAGRFAIGPAFFEPLTDDELAAWDMV